LAGFATPWPGFVTLRFSQKSLVFVSIPGENQVY